MRQAPELAGATRGEVGGADVRRDRADRVAAGGGPVRDLLQLRRDFFLGPEGGRGQLPGAPVGVVDQPCREGGVGAAPLGLGGHRHHRRPGQRVPELQAPGEGVDVDEVGDLGRSQRLETVAGSRVRARVGQDAQVAGAVEGGEQQQVAGLGGQRGHPGGEDRLEPVGDRQHVGHPQ